MDNFYEIIDDFYLIKSLLNGEPFVSKRKKKAPFYSKPDLEVAIEFCNSMNEHYGVNSWYGLLYKTYLSNAYIQIKSKGKEVCLKIKISDFFSDKRIDDFRKINIGSHSKLRASAESLSKNKIFLVDFTIKNEFNLVENEKKEWKKRGMFIECCFRNRAFNPESKECTSCAFENKDNFEKLIFEE